VSLHRGLGGPEPVGPDRVGDLGGERELRRVGRAAPVARGTLACPACDAPVALPPGGAAPPDAMACPFCAHAARVRDFLSLGDPTRPARVEVRVVARRP
jgi:hypothetical protein